MQTTTTQKIIVLTLEFTKPHFFELPRHTQDHAILGRADSWKHPSDKLDVLSARFDSNQTLLPIRSGFRYRHFTYQKDRPALRRRRESACYTKTSGPNNHVTHHDYRPSPPFPEWNPIFLEQRFDLHRTGVTGALQLVPGAPVTKVQQIVTLRPVKGIQITIIYARWGGEFHSYG